ncbi:MAG: S41 family peptidase, partial [Phycisphaerae bacterium]
VLAFEFLNAAMRPLDDFTSIIWPSEVADFEKHTHGEFTGVGIQITKPDGQPIRVETPLEDSPAFNAGVSPGDFIIAVDGESTRDMKLNDAVRKITGPIGSRVRLTMERPGQTEQFEKELERQRIKIRSVKGWRRTPDGASWDFMIDTENRIGYVRVSQFTKDTVRELREAITQLDRRGGAALILDLRFNPGGLLTAAIESCELFLDPGDAIVKTRGRAQGERPAAEAERKAEYDLGPIIILVNEQSASASEIVAGTLAGHNKAFIIGERTFGKGSVQNLYEIAGRTAYFKLTTALYYVPSDAAGRSWRSLHHEDGDEMWGVEPHMEVKLIPNEIRRLFELRRRRELINRDAEAPPESLFEQPKSPSTQPEDDIAVPNDAPLIDPQLETALSVMRMKLVSKQPWVLAPKLANSAPPKQRPGEPVGG